MKCVCVVTYCFIFTAITKLEEVIAPVPEVVVAPVPEIAPAPERTQGPTPVLELLPPLQSIVQSEYTFSTRIHSNVK